MAELRRNRGGEIGRPHVKDQQPTMAHVRYSFYSKSRVLLRPLFFQRIWRMKETRTTALNFTSQWRDHLNWKRVLITASMISRGIFKDLSQCSGRGLKSRPPAQHSRSLQSLLVNNWAVYPWQGKKGQFNSPVTSVKRLHSKALFLIIVNRQLSQSNFSVTFSFVGLNGI